MPRPERHSSRCWKLLLVFFFNFTYLFYFGRPRSSLLQALFLAVESSSYSLVVMYGLLTAGTSLVTEQGL